MSLFREVFLGQGQQFYRTMDGEDWKWPEVEFHLIKTTWTVLPSDKREVSFLALEVCKQMLPEVWRGDCGLGRSPH